MGYKVVSSIKNGPQRGDSYSGEDAEELHAQGVLMTDQEFNVAFPNFGEEPEVENQATGTPSNLTPNEELADNDLLAPDPSEDDDEDDDEPPA